MTELEDIARGKGADARQARRTLKRRAGASGTLDDFAPLTDVLEGLAARFDTRGARKLGRDISADLRTANARRIRANVTPDGAAMAPRKALAGGKTRTKRLRDDVSREKKSEREAAMFRRATAPRYLRRESSQGEAQVGFVGAMARIMRVHHHGLRDTVTRDPASPEVTYPVRPILGLTPDDRLRILAQVEAAIAP